MPELLVQSALAASRSAQFAAEATSIKADCHEHCEASSLLACPRCYETLLEAFRARYLGPRSGSTAEEPTAADHQQQHRKNDGDEEQQRQWFTPRHDFLSSLSFLLDSAKEYQILPQVVDDRVREERSRWYAERVRASLLRLMVEDPSHRAAVFEKLEDLSSTTTTGEDLVRVTKEVAEILRRSPLAADQGPHDLPERLAAATDREGSVKVLREAFFTAGDGAVPADHQKYLDMLQHQGLSLEQVLDRILDDRQAAAGAKEQADKLGRRLDELRRARAAHEAQKSRKAQRRESLAQQRVPDELYNIPACVVCGGAPNAEDYFCCSICTVLAGTGVQQQQTVFCSPECEQKGHLSHAATHTCASATDCIQPDRFRRASSTGDQDTHMDEAPASQDTLSFCTECLTSLKQPTMWCSPACADANFYVHREQVHLPERKRLNLDVDDEPQLAYGETEADGDRRYRAKDIGRLTTSLSATVREWEDRNRVRLQPPE